MPHDLAIRGEESKDSPPLSSNTTYDESGSISSDDGSHEIGSRPYPNFSIEDHLSTLKSLKQQDLTNEDGINALPRRRNKSQRPLAMQLAQLMWPELPEIAAIIRYEDLVLPAKTIVRYRKMERDRQIHIPASNLGGRMLRIQGPWAGQELDPADLKGPVATPMPVKIGSEQDFAPIFGFLAQDKSIHQDDVDVGIPGFELLWGNPTLEFDRGIVYEDGRLDLCKMVVGPTHIGKLMESLESNHKIRHFLLGNNAISTTGAKSIAEFISKYPDRMETWYLAGCHITRHGLSLLAPSMLKSKSITNLWFKRNPFGPNSSGILAELVLKTQNLRTLDLETTELGDEGVYQFITSITGKPSSLRHIYLNANGIGEKACESIGKYLAHPSCLLESLFLSTNPIGDAGMQLLAPGLSKSKTLKRFTCASSGLTSKGLAYFADTVTSNDATAPLMTLDLGSSQTTIAHGLKYNYFDEACVPALQKLMLLPTLHYLDLERCAFSANGLQSLHDTATTSNLVYFNVQRVHLQNPETNPDTGIAVKTCSLGLRNALVKNQQKFYPNIKEYAAFITSEEFRFLRNIEDVRKIDSMYRTRNKREAVPNEQVWEEGDETWRLIVEDAEAALRELEVV